MPEITLKNDALEIKVKMHGAELCSLKDVKTGTQYLWNADPKTGEEHHPYYFLLWEV